MVKFDGLSYALKRFRFKILDDDLLYKIFRWNSRNHSLKNIAPMITINLYNFKKVHPIRFLDYRYVEFNFKDPILHHEMTMTSLDIFLFMSKVIDLELE